MHKIDICTVFVIVCCYTLTPLPPPNIDNFSTSLDNVFLIIILTKAYKLTDSGLFAVFYCVAKFEWLKINYFYVPIALSVASQQTIARNITSSDANILSPLHKHILFAIIVNTV